MSDTYQALYRKWRPMTFDDLVGQDHVSNTLKNSVASHRLAHAYLFCGTRGTGKTSTAKIFSRAVNCLSPVDGEPCNECDVCRGILNGSILDVYEMDAASNRGVDDIRSIRDEVIYTPAGCTYKVYIIDEVHMLTDVAFNALLKTLEEPPEHAIFILATTEPHKIPATILSRCQRFDFRRIGPYEISCRLTKITEAEGIKATPDALELIAELGDGSMRDALSILDQCAAFDVAELRVKDVVDIVGIVDPQTLFDIADSIIDTDAPGALLKADSFLKKGKEALNFFEDIIAHFRNLLICKAGDNIEDLLEKTADATAKYKAQADKCGTDQILYIIKILSEMFVQAKTMSAPEIAVEMALVKVCTPQRSDDMQAILARLDKLERMIQRGVSAPTSTPAPVQEKTVEVKVEEEELPPWDMTPEEEPVYEAPVEDVPVYEEIKSDVAEPWDLWAEALNEIKNNSKKLYAFMYSAKVTECGDVIEVEIPEAVAYEKIATPNGIEYLKNLFSEISGSAKNVEVVLKGEKKSVETPKGSIMELANKKNIFGDRMEIL